MESQVISPIMNLLLVHIETCRQPHGLRRVVGVELQFLLHRQSEELRSYPEYHLDRLLRHPMINDLKEDFRHIPADARATRN